jgi:hypothetical protein
VVQAALAETFARAARGEGLPVGVSVTSAGPVLTIGDLLRLHGEDTPALVLMLLALVSVMPVAGAGMVLSLGVFAIAWRWRQGGRAVTLPERLRRLPLGPTGTRRSLRLLAWLYARTGRCLRPRWSGLARPGLAGAWSLWLGAMGFLIFLPLPLGNVLPAASLVLFSLGWMFRDGLALVASLAVGALATAFALVVGHVLVDLASQASQIWGSLL